MATFNGSRHILRQVYSILDQLALTDELVISDDNSTDNTRELLYELADDRIKIYINKFTPGPVGNFQNAIMYATGDYILLADQDDVWISSKISVTCANLQHYDLVLSDCIVVDQELKVLIPSFFTHRGSKPGFWRNLYKNSYMGCCMGFRREVLKYILPFPAHIHMHDWWIGLVVETYGQVKFISEPLIKYVRHGDNASPTGESSSNSIWSQLLNRLGILWCVLYLRILK